MNALRRKLVLLLRVHNSVIVGYYEYITVLSLVNFVGIHLSSVVDPYSEYGSRKVKQEKKSEANQIQDKHFTFRDPAE